MEDKYQYPRTFEFLVSEPREMLIKVNPAVSFRNVLNFTKVLNVYEDTEPEKFRQLIDVLGEEFVIYCVEYLRPSDNGGISYRDTYTSFGAITPNLELIGITYEDIIEFNKLHRI